LTASSESEAQLLTRAQERRTSLRLAVDLGALPPAAARPGRPDGSKAPIAYMLPAAAAVEEGMGAVSDSGIRARGITLKSYAGAEVRVPADGTISFAGPFRRHDGVVIIDHGRGWKTLMTGVRTDLRKGDAVRRGDRLGRALGPVGVELSTNGTPVSAALIAGSSDMVSNRPNSG
jgi:murein DD-endopeptidase MepM/ murein hydrolase activator NlpD